MSAVAFICTANRCRSVIAHAICQSEVTKRSLPVDVYSAGVMDFSDAPVIFETTQTCLVHKTPAPDKPPTWVGNLPLDSITRFFVMERYHAHSLMRDFGIDPEKITLLGDCDPQRRGSEIEDPFSQGDRVFKKCYARIRDCIVNYLDSEYPKA